MLHPITNQAMAVDQENISQEIYVSPLIPPAINSINQTAIVYPASIQLIY